MQDQAIEDSITRLMKPLDPSSTGAIEETQFWDTLEDPESGYDIGAEQAFTMMQTYDTVDVSILVGMTAFLTVFRATTYDIETLQAFSSH